MKHAIAAGHEITAKVGDDVLRAGGNAFDAAVACLLAACVTEPCMASVGGGAFATLFDKEGKSYCVDFFCQTPKSNVKKKEAELKEILIDFGDEQEIYYAGKGSSAVPGTLKGLDLIQQKFGKMPLRELAQPAIQLAKEGVLLNEFQAFDLKLLTSIFHLDTSYRHVFFNGDQPKEIGDLIRMEDLADFLDYYSREGADAFYRGEVAAKLVSDHTSGGFLTDEDLQNYQPIVKRPFQFPFQNVNVHCNNYPSAGGPIIALLLHKLESGLALDQSLIEVKEFKDKPHLLRAKLDQLMPGHNYLSGQGPMQNRGTSHFNILDKEGNAISLTTSIGEGCGYFVPGTGIHMNNMLGEIGLLPNGLNSWLPNKRLASMMTPTIISKENKARLILGSGGASRIPYMIAQVINEYVQNGNLEAAINHPRIYFDGQTIHSEVEYKSEISQYPFNFWSEKSLYFGGVHSISSNNGHLEAVGDPRRFGAAIIS